MGLEPDPDDSLIAAAEAAASWAHARRAKWTKEPLRVPESASTFSEIEFEFEQESAVVSPPPVAPQPPVAPKPPPVVPPPPPAAPTPSVARPLVFEWPTAVEAEPIAAPVPAPVPTPGRRETPAASARVAGAARGLAEPLRQWLPRIAAVAALGAAVFAGVRYLPGLISTGASKLKPAATARPKPAATPSATVARKATGALNVKSTPIGAQVIVDGKPRGVTPLALNDVSPGHHEIVLRSDAGIVRRGVTVTANGTADIDEAIFSGWISVLSPIEVEIVENGRVLRPDERSQIMLPPGVHDLRFANKALGYDTVRQVEVKPGEATNIRLTPEPGKVTVTTSEPAEVWIDGNRIGDAPLMGVGVPLGTHELVVKRNAGGERRYTVTIGVAPYTLFVDFSQG